MFNSVLIFTILLAGLYLKGSIRFLIQVLSNNVSKISLGCLDFIYIFVLPELAPKKIASSLHFT